MKIDILEKIKPTVGKVKFTLKKYSPEILIAGGIIGIVASTIMACVATTKVHDILNDGKNKAKEIHTYEITDKYTEHDVKRDLTATYLKTGVKLVRIYLPSLILGGLSITSVVSSNVILKKRTVALTAAYATLDASFKDYRKRVVEKFGDTVDRDLKYGVSEIIFDGTTVDPNTGKELAVTKAVKTSEYDGYSDYARYFDETSIYYSANLDYNRMFLKAQQQYANDKLQADGYLFLNDVYDSLGIPKTKAGQIVGWIYDKNNTEGDNLVDFGIYDLLRADDESAFEEYEKSGKRLYLLDFNVDGPILERVTLSA